jgi:hypothetical protein
MHCFADFFQEVSFPDQKSTTERNLNYKQDEVYMDTATIMLLNKPAGPIGFDANWDEEENKTQSK